MGLVDSPNGEGRSRKAKQKRKRIGFHIDMTPMVDVAFLLLTFFMLTTTFGKANTMEINIPPENSEVRIAEDNVMTLRIVENGIAYWSVGESRPSKIFLYGRGDEAPMSLSKEVRELLLGQTKANSKLAIVVRISDRAKYKSLVDLIDEFNLMKIDRFSLDDFTEADEEAIRLVASSDTTRPEGE